MTSILLFRCRIRQLNGLSEFGLLDELSVILSDVYSMVQTIAGVCEKDVNPFIFFLRLALGQDSCEVQLLNKVARRCHGRVFFFSVQKWVISVPSHAAVGCLSKARVGWAGCAWMVSGHAIVATSFTRFSPGCLLVIPRSIFIWVVFPCFSRSFCGFRLSCPRL